MERAEAVDRVVELLDTVEADPMPVPVREVWVYGDVALGLDPVERLDVYIRKDVRMGGDDEFERRFRESHGVRGVGRTVSAEWAERFPEHVRAGDNGYAAPERCLAAHLVDDDEPIHLEVCNASFDDNVTQRLKGALARGAYGEILDPRGVCLWVDGRRSEEALAKVRAGDLPFPTLAEALEMLGADEATASEAADVLGRQRAERAGRTVRGDVV